MSAQTDSSHTNRPFWTLGKVVATAAIGSAVTAGVVFTLHKDKVDGTNERNIVTAQKSVSDIYTELAAEKYNTGFVEATQDSFRTYCIVVANHIAGDSEPVKNKAVLDAGCDHAIDGVPVDLGDMKAVAGIVKAQMEDNMTSKAENTLVYSADPADTQPSTQATQQFSAGLETMRVRLQQAQENCKDLRIAAGCRRPVLVRDGKIIHIVVN